jgi:hypothetical protein
MHLRSILTQFPAPHSSSCRQILSQETEDSTKIDSVVPPVKTFVDLTLGVIVATFEILPEE